jgi:two-component sensor histidine kinase
VFVSLCVVVAGDGMRTALERQVATQKTANLLLEEQEHRIKNELATNTLKHAFPDDRAGAIYVRLRRTEAGLTIDAVV